MLQKIKDYAKCAIRNKLTICGYAGMGLAYLMKYIEHATGTQIPADDLLLYSSFPIFGVTKCGIGTYKAYTRTKKHIAEHGTIDSRFKDKFSPVYCNQIGIKMAAEEAGLENLI